MEIQPLLSKPVWQMTGEELLFLSRQTAHIDSHTASTQETPTEKRYVFGIAGRAMRDIRLQQTYRYPHQEKR